ncbi:hypothetical protein [Calycomorphotria hydatis]|uniref:Uncharacterized protein n=1 Tax=Calycomorphotria hydatis TaxID=2528027 RepID=A0A517T9N3_9PLAN|nr:hypothetical protein [Calycomorphotria hydatis]QDT65081.1 hypothetical protein V22_23270 [Calycomorphotria hydatis]
MRVVPCPDCHTPLRLREEVEPSETIECPECSATLKLAGEEFERVTLPSKKRQSPGKTSSPSAPTTPVLFNHDRWERLQSRMAPLVDGLQQPLTIAWGVAAISACVLGFLFIQTLSQTDATPVPSPLSPITKNEDSKLIEPSPSAVEQTATPNDKSNSSTGIALSTTNDQEEETGKPVPPQPLSTPVEAERPKVLFVSVSQPEPEDRLLPTLQERLQVPVRRFIPTRETTFGEMRQLFEELLATHIRYSEKAIEPAKYENRNVAVTGENLPLEAILSSACDEVGLRFRVEQDQIVLEPSATENESL